MLSQTNDLQIKQELQINEQMIQSLNILSMEYADLLLFINQTLDENPLIEIKDDSNYRKNYNSGERNDVLNYVQESPDLIDYLLDQIGLIDIDNHLIKPLKYLIYNLNKKGFLTLSLETLAKMSNYPLADLNAARDILVELDPIGIGTPNVKECLKKQVKNDLIHKIIDYHLEDVAKQDIKKICKNLEKDHSEIVKAIKQLKELNPIPSAGFSHHEPVNYIVPEASVRVKNSEILVTFHSEQSPQLSVENSHLFSSDSLDNDARQFYSSQYNLCQSINKAILKRGETIRKLIYYIVKTQKDYFLKGVEGLQPIMKKEAASILEVSPSTITRATKNKFISTPFGIKSLDYFFQRYSNENNANRHGAKETLRLIIKREDRRKPYSDNELVKKMSEKGLKISRRTISQYRSELMIPSSYKRKIQ